MAQNARGKACLMSYVLNKASYESAESLVKKDLLAYIDYGSPQGSRIFSWPQYVIENDTVSPIDPSTFPDVGCLPMTVAGGSQEKDKLENGCGSLVVMKINDSDFKNNYYYGPGGEPHAYNSIIDPARKPGKSIIEFKTFASQSASCRLVQVIYLDGGSMDFSTRPDKPVFPYADQASPVAKYVMIAQVEGRKRLLYGPFEMQQAAGASGFYTIDASPTFDRYVYAIDEASFAFNIELADKDKVPFAQFIDIDELQELIRATEPRYDWIPNSELIDAYGRLAKTALPDLSKADVKSLKAALESATDLDAKIKMSDERRGRMLHMMDSYESWEELSHERKAEAVGSIPAEKLAEYVLTDDHFAGFYEMVAANDQVRRKVEALEADMNAKADAAKKRAEEALARARAAEEECAKAESARDEQKRQIIQEAQAELDKTMKETTELQKTKKELEAHIEELREGEYAARSAIRKVVNDFQEEQAVSEHILKSVAVQELVQSLGGASGTATPGSAAAPQPEPAEVNAPVLLAGQDEMTPGAILDRVYDAVSVRAGRELPRNEIANLLICLTQGYITTFAGYPGTGKTSLAGLIAGALGLTQPNAKRYCEVSVERGWTSYKDFIGYYNPFSQRVEPANSSAFSAFAALDTERASAAPHVPYLMLLDEANLSSIEHYWSPFLLACDRKDGSAELNLSLGGGASFSVPNWLRFIATVNFDHTTEELSPRFLDRSWVIMLEPQDFDFDNDDFQQEDTDFSAQEALGIDALQAAFGPRRSSIDVAPSSRLREVIETCKAAGMNVSPRSQLMMRNYVSAALSVMDTSTAATADDPVDFAVCQKVLPRVSGSEENAKQLLEAICKINNLPRTRAQAERMLKAGEGSGFYQFFA